MPAQTRLQSHCAMGILAEIQGVVMALIRCGECGREVSDRASSCPSCGAPVDVTTAIASPERLSYDGGLFIGTSAMVAELAKKAIGRLNYRVDSANISAGTVSFTTGITMGSWSGVSGTLSWEEVAPYQFKLSGHGKQNVQGGQVVAFNLFDEANGKAQNVITEMARLAQGGSEGEAPAGGCALILIGLIGSAVAGAPIISRFV